MVHLLLALIYISFISLGLPDGLLGAAWPSMYGGLEVPVSYAGIISMIICVGTILSSLMSERLTHKLGAGKVTAISVCLTAAALFGFSFSTQFWMLCLWAIPYGLGAGSVDASLNNYVALHYSSRHMSWLHCMWGVGASTGPYIIGFVLSGGMHWSMGYRLVGLIQVLLTALLFISLPIWKSSPKNSDGTDSAPVPLHRAVKIPGAKEVMITFFCYCALEQTAALWSGSYLTLYAGLSEEAAASFASLFFLGITAGRAVSGFVTMKLNDTQMIRLGICIIAAGVLVLLLPLGIAGAMAGLLLVGLGCAPIYPCIMHATPEHFGADKSQALMGIQTASAYVGTALMPPLFGLIANHISISLLGIYLLIILVIMTLTHELMVKKCAH
ncbi:MAG: MFS transporter [Oscillospiraceae bacterium]|nr:MFS transporter [Oscillospiraceae bacterium]